MNALFAPFRKARSKALLGALAGSALLTGCYVVPIQPSPAPPSVVYMPAPLPHAAPMAPAPVTFAARLYPANELATPIGMIGAVVTNDLNGRGTFTTNIHGESFVGEATRVTSAGGMRAGVANGAGNRGSFINCRYQMNSPTLGTGQCTLSNGALFTMHVGG